MRHEALVVVAAQTGAPDWGEFRKSAARDDSYVSVTILAGARAVRVLPPMAARLSPVTMLIPRYSDAPQADAYIGLVDLLLEAEALVSGLTTSSLHLFGPTQAKDAIVRLLIGSSIAIVTSDMRSVSLENTSATNEGGREGVSVPVRSTVWTWPVLHQAGPDPVRLEYSADDIEAARALASKTLGRDIQAAEFDVTRAPTRRGLFRKETVVPAVLEVTQRLTPGDFDQRHSDSGVRTLLAVPPIEWVIHGDIYQGFLLQTSDDYLSAGTFLVPGAPGVVSTLVFSRTHVAYKYRSEIGRKIGEHAWPPDLGDIQDVGVEGFGPKLASEVKPGDAVRLDRARGNLAWVATLASGTRFAVANSPGNGHGWRLDRHTHCQIPVAGVVTGVRRDVESGAVTEIRILYGSVPALSNFAAG